MSDGKTTLTEQDLLAGCECHREEGDSPCRIHGEEEDVRGHARDNTGCDV